MFKFEKLKLSQKREGSECAKHLELFDFVFSFVVFLDEN